MKRFSFLLIAMAMLTTGAALAQSKFAGKYDLLSGYTDGYYAGLFGYGIASVSRKGVASYSSYYPYVGVSGSGTGTINSKGIFRLNNGTSGTAAILSRRVGVGKFNDSMGNGLFALKKR